MPWRTIFFGVNFAACLGWIVLAAGVIIGSSDGGAFPFAVVVGVATATPAIALALAEWMLFARRAASLERPLGIVAGAVAVLAIFGLVANIVEAALRRSGGAGGPGIGFWITFVPTCLAVASYGVWCCWLRVRRRTLPPPPRGFAVSLDRGAVQTEAG